MLQNRAVTSPLSTTTPPDLAGSLERTLTSERLQVVKRTFSLPNSLHSFLVFTLLLILVCAALFAHLLLSTALHQGELQLVELQRTNQEIVRESTVIIEQIAEESSLQRGMERVLEQGYTVAYDRQYLAQPTGPQPDFAQAQTLGAGTEASLVRNPLPAGLLLTPSRSATDGGATVGVDGGTAAAVGQAAPGQTTEVVVTPSVGQ